MSLQKGYVKTAGEKCSRKGYFYCLFYKKKKKKLWKDVLKLVNVKKKKNLLTFCFWIFKVAGKKLKPFQRFNNFCPGISKMSEFTAGSTINPLSKVD